MGRESVRRAAGFGGLVLSLFAAGCQTDAFFYRKNRAPKGEQVQWAALSGEVAPTLARQEADLVEQVVHNRTEYMNLLRDVAKHYRDIGRGDLADQAAFEWESLESAQQFYYLLDAEVPNVVLNPSESIPEADALYNEGQKLLKEGGHNIPIFYRQKRMIEALKTFRRLVFLYPTSDKVDDAAFFMGEIHKEYLSDQELIAVRWYERAYQWNPQTPHPARFQAAVVYDYRLKDRAHALELYHAVLDHETWNGSNRAFAERRITELTRS